MLCIASVEMTVYGVFHKAIWDNNKKVSIFSKEK